MADGWWRPGPGATWFPEGGAGRGRGGAGDGDGGGGAPPRCGVTNIVQSLQAASPPGTDVVVDYGGSGERAAGGGYMVMSRYEAAMLAAEGRRLGGTAACVDGVELLFDHPPQEADPIVCWGRRQALLVAVDYFGQPGELGGGANDISAMRQLLSAHGFAEPQTLSEHSGEPPTRDNILDALRALVAGARAGDCFFFAFAGRGGRTPAGEDAERGCALYAETLLPVDHEAAGAIHGAELAAELFAPLPRGSRLTCVLDCARGGCPLDLPYVFTATARRLTAAFACEHPRMLCAEMPPGAAEPRAEVVVLSSTTRDDGAVEDERLSPDAAEAAARSGGACCGALTAALWREPVRPALRLLAGLRDRMHEHGALVAPRLATSRCYDLRRPFRLDSITPTWAQEYGPGQLAAWDGPMCRCARRMQLQHRCAPPGPAAGGGGRPEWFRGGWHCLACRQLGSGDYWACPGCSAELCLSCAPPAHAFAVSAAAQAAMAAGAAERAAAEARGAAVPPGPDEPGWLQPGEECLARQPVLLRRPYGVPGGRGAHAPAGAEGLLTLRRRLNAGGACRLVLDLPGAGGIEVPERDVPFLLTPAPGSDADEWAGSGVWWPTIASANARATELARRRTIAVPPPRPAPRARPVACPHVTAPARAETSRDTLLRVTAAGAPSAAYCSGSPARSLAGRELFDERARSLAADVASALDDVASARCTLSPPAADAAWRAGSAGAPAPRHAPPAPPSEPASSQASPERGGLPALGSSEYEERVRRAQERHRVYFASKSRATHGTGRAM